MPIIPNEIIITINTSIPGYQKIKYTPSMTIKNISNDDSTIRFNPLTKLSKSIIDKIPEDLRKKEFFNRCLFESLLNYTNNHIVKTLDQATREGFIDNNIKITLNTLFPDDSIIYIGNKPYSISDIQWSNGDWKIDTKKKKEEFNKSKITNPYLYKTIVQDDIISGQKQLNLLPVAMIYGPNYVGSKLSNTASGNKLNQPLLQAKVPLSLPLPSAKAPLPLPGAKVPLPLPLPSAKVPLPSAKVPLPSAAQSLPSVTQASPSAQSLSLSSQPVANPLKKLIANVNKTNMIKQIFSNNFYNLINNIFKASDDTFKKIIQETLIQPTITNGKTSDKNLNNQIYTDSINGLSIVENSGGGDCFFIAVADAINYHNYNNQTNRIISGRYGTGVTLYTQLYLRNLVYNFLQNWSGLDDQFDNSQIYVDDLNDKFTASINGLKSALISNGKSDNISLENYLDLATNIFMSNENFLIDNITNIPIIIGDYERPFKIIKKSQLKNYILSKNYWANALAVYGLCEQLKLNIIPISIEGNIISIPFANFTEDNGWDKYLFLYYSNSHFELITFTYKTNIPTIKNTITIFNRIDFSPIYMLLAIFGANYSTINDPTNKFNFTFKKEIMEIIENTIDVKLYDTLKSNYETDFYNIFKSYFPDSKIKQPSNSPTQSNASSYHPPATGAPGPLSLSNPTGQIFSSNPFSIFGFGGGGYNPQYNPQYNSQYNSQYRNPYIESKMKKEENSDSSKLAYYITIYMELYPGTSIPPEEKSNLKCKSNWNSVRKAYADFLGKPYIIPPVYNSNKTLNNNTKKNIPNKLAVGGKKNNTKKRII